MRWLALAAVFGCVQQNGPRWGGSSGGGSGGTSGSPAGDCGWHGFIDPTDDVVHVPVAQIGGVAGETACDAAPTSYTVTVVNRTTGNSMTIVSSDGVCMPVLFDAMAKVYYWAADVPLVAGQNSIRAGESGGCDEVTITYMPGGSPDAIVDASTPDAPTPVIQITEPTDTHFYNTSASSVLLQGICAAIPDNQEVWITSDHSTTTTAVSAGTTWQVDWNLVPYAQRITAHASFGGVESTDYIDVVYYPDGGTL